MYSPTSVLIPTFQRSRTAVPSTMSPAQFYGILLSEMRPDTNKLNILDVILLEDSQPRIWLRTDANGFLSKRIITSMSIEELVKSVLNDIGGSKPTIEHSDILVFL